MAEKTFTDKLIELLINGDLPNAQGDKATETGLIIACAKGKTPVCASYGSSKEIVFALVSTLKQNQSIREALVLAITGYAKIEPLDPIVLFMKTELMKN